MDDSSMARMMDMNGTQTRLECGPSAIFHPLVPTKENAFNPCFISWAYTYLAIIFAVVCGIDLIRAVRLPKHGSYIPKSTGIHHWVRCNAVLLQGVLYLVLLQFTNIHYRYADTKILAMLTTMVTIGGGCLTLAYGGDEPCGHSSCVIVGILAVVNDFADDAIVPRSVYWMASIHRRFVSYGSGVNACQLAKRYSYGGMSDLLETYTRVDIFP